MSEAGVVKEIAGHVAEAMKSQPVAVGLIVINLLYLGAGTLFMAEVTKAIADERTAGRALLQEVIANCTPRGG